MCINNPARMYKILSVPKFDKSELKFLDVVDFFPFPFIQIQIYEINYLNFLTHYGVLGFWGFGVLGLFIHIY
jgi:hypothetical protein